MASNTLYRFAGTLLLIGSAGGLVAHALHQQRPHDPALFVQYAALSGPVHVLLYFACMLVMISFPAVLARQHQRLGILGALATVGIVVGMGVSELAHCVLEFSAVPSFAAATPTTALALMNTIEGSEIPALSLGAGIAGIGLMLSFPLFAFLTLRARVLSRWPAILMFGFMGAAAASMLPGVPERLGDLVVGLGLYVVFASFGVALLADTRSRQPAELSAAQPATQLNV